MSLTNNEKSLLYCTLLSLQFGLQPLISTQFTSKLISKTSIVMMTEITKIVLSALSISTESYEVRQRILKSWSFVESLQIAALPAILYAVQNMLVQKGYTLVDSMTFNLLNQTKTLSAAFFLWIILGHKQSIMQIFALFLLLAAAVVLNMGSKASAAFGSLESTKLLDSNYQLGVLVVLGASLTSGICAALIQKAFQLPVPRHPLVYSSELAVYGIITLIIHDAISGQNAIMNNGGLFANWDVYALIPVTTNAFGGLVVGLVSKYAGGVVKGFALIAGLLVTALAQWFIEKKPLGVEHGVAAVLVSLSIFIHSSYPIVKNKDKQK